MILTYLREHPYPLFSPTSTLMPPRSLRQRTYCARRGDKKGLHSARFQASAYSIPMATWLITFTLQIVQDAIQPGHAIIQSLIRLCMRRSSMALLGAWSERHLRC